MLPRRRGLGNNSARRVLPASRRRPPSAIRYPRKLARPKAIHATALVVVPAVLGVVLTLPSVFGVLDMQLPEPKEG